MHLYGRSWTRRELEARVGSISQIGGVRRMQLTEGKERDVEAIQVRTGAGLTYYVIPSKGLDISLAELGGMPVSWQSPNGDVHPAYYEAEGTGWLRTASGGLLMTCGLAHV
ncbi:aldose 1-epimerase family protein, partial [Paenibacillus sepulcri]|nr:aldose 1-epimerase family protein [Paenibacillus sepulcri]